MGHSEVGRFRAANRHFKQASNIAEYDGFKAPLVGGIAKPNPYMDLYERLPFAKDEINMLGQIGCSFISGLSCRSMPAGPDGIR